MATVIDKCSFAISILSQIKSAGDLSSALDRLEKTYSLALTDGTGANHAKNHWHDQRTLGVSAAEDLDLAGGLTNLLGDVITFTKIKAIFVFAATANTNNVEVGGAAANQFPLFKAVTDILPVRPGGVFWITAPDANGIAVTAGTGDKLQIKNSGAGTSVTYDIILVGTT
jgi:hypothetical protein